MRRLVMALLVFCACTTVAQTGLPLWGSFETSSLDAVNRQNLNVHLTIPLVNAPSRGGAFNYNLVYDSLIWTKSGTAWTPVTDANGSPTWGWQDNYGLGTTAFYHNNGVCDTEPPTYSPHYYGYRYTDWNGTVHKFGFGVNFYLYPTACEFNTGPRTGSDGSGYFLDASSPSYPIIYSPSGDVITGTRTDANGNYVSGVVVGSSEIDYKDTAGRVTLKAIKNSNTQKQYKILDQNGTYTNAVATATYASRSIKTHFSCSGVTEYTGSTYLITQLALPNGRSYSFTYEDTPGFSGYTTGRVKKVTLPTGGYYEYDYPTTGNNGIYCTDASVSSVTRIISDGTTSNTWQFTRSGTGLTTMTETAPKLPYDPAANATVYTFSSSGLVTQQKVYQGAVAGNPIQTINTSYAANGTPSVTTTILEDQQTQTKVETDFDANTNLTEKREYAWGTGAPGALVRRTTMTYLTGSPYTIANILNRVTQVLIKDGSGAVKARTDIEYDSYGSNMTCVIGAAQHNDTGYGCSFTTRGNPTSITTYTDAATLSGPIRTNLFYDSLGNVRKADVNGVVQSQLAYSTATQYAFPDSVTRGPSSGPQLTTSATYNANTGLIATSTDENNQVTHYTYDNLRRLTDVQRPDSAHITYAYDDTNQKVTFSAPVQGSDVARQITYLDPLGRVNKTAIADVANITYSITEAQYDPLGNAYKVSNPHNSTAQHWTETDVDALGRTTKVILPDGNQTTYSYAATTLTITDPAGHQNKQDVDALGRLATLYEPDVNNGNALAQQTTYAYNVLDGLTTVTQGAQTRSYVYDSLGRATQITIPEAGQVQYQYNDLSQVTQRTDARGVITTSTYDTLNRPYQTSYNVGSTGVPATPTVTLTYGTSAAQYNNGRLITQATDGVESDSFTYDQLGRVTGVSKNVTGAQTYNIGYGYNLAGELTSITYPSTRVLTQTYDGIGRLSQVSDGTPRTYANQFSYNPAQELLGYTAGNGVQGTFSYSDSRLQLGSLSYVIGANALLSLGYGYTQNNGNNGQITAITDNLTSANSLTFTYDALGRLTRGKTASLTAPNTWDISWVYDRYGNRTNQTSNGGTLAVTNQNLTFNSNNQPREFAFDVSGNMTDDGVVHNYVYDAENRFVQLGTTGVNVYDSANLRVKKTNGGTTVVYVFSGTKVIAEYDNTAPVGAPTREYILAGDWVISRLGSVDVRFTNDSCSGCGGTPVGGGDRNLVVNFITVGSTTILPNDPSVSYTTSPCNRVDNGVAVLACNGDMITTASTAETAQTITVNAYGSTDYDIYPHMQLLVGGVIVGEWDVTGTAQNYTVTLQTTGTQYFLKDHLSNRAVTDSTGNTVAQMGHLPFGEAWYSTGAVDKWKFTSYERDDDTSLDYAINRFDSPRLGRFMTPDPYDGSIDLANPQSWNRYPYVMGDPVDWVDPTGLREVPCPPDYPPGSVCVVVEEPLPPDPPINPSNCVPGVARVGCSQTPGRTVLVITLTEWDDVHPHCRPPFLCKTAANNGDVPLNPYAQAVFSQRSLQTAAATMTNPCTYVGMAVATGVPGVGIARAGAMTTAVADNAPTLVQNILNWWFRLTTTPGKPGLVSAAVTTAVNTGKAAVATCKQF